MAAAEEKKQDTAAASLCVIVMATRSWGVGNRGAVPWVLPSELMRTQQLTAIASPGRANAIILGATTYLKLPVPRTFAGRKVAVLTSHADFIKMNKLEDEVIVASSVGDAMAKLQAAVPNLERAFVLGGRSAFMEAMASPQCDDIYVTRILKPEVSCDDVVPAVSSAFALVEEDEARTEGDWTFKHEHYRRGGGTVIRTVVSKGGTAASNGTSGTSGTSSSSTSKRTTGGASKPPKSSTRASASRSSGRARSRSPRSSKASTQQPRRSSPRRTSPRRPQTTSTRRRGPPPATERLYGKVQPVMPRLQVVNETPGPGAYETETSIGTQRSSYRPTSSQWSFGSASRDAYHRQFLNKQLQEGVLNRNTKDVDFVNVSATGRQTLSSKKTLPAYSFGRAPRDQYHKEYLNKEMAKGVQLQTTKNVDFMNPSDSTLALGAYSHAAKHNNSPRTTFGSSGRYLYEKQFMGNDFQARMVKADPGMNTVELTSYGRQVQSTKPTAPSFGFGTSSRARRAKLALVKAAPTQSTSVRNMTSPRMSPRATRDIARAEVARAAVAAAPVPAPPAKQSQVRRSTSVRQQSTSVRIRQNGRQQSSFRQSGRQSSYRQSARQSSVRVRAQASSSRRLSYNLQRSPVRTGRAIRKAPRNPVVRRSRQTRAADPDRWV